MRTRAIFCFEFGPGRHLGLMTFHGCSRSRPGCLFLNSITVFRTELKAFLFRRRYEMIQNITIDIRYQIYIRHQSLCYYFFFSSNRVIQITESLQLKLFLIALVLGLGKESIQLLLKSQLQMLLTINIQLLLAIASLK